MSKRQFVVGKQSFTSLTSAVIEAREIAKRKRNPSNICVPVFDMDRMLLIAVVSDDGNGLTVHRLSTWPEDCECPY